MNTNPYCRVKSFSLLGLVFHGCILYTLCSCSSTKILIPKIPINFHANGVAIQQLSHGMYETFSYNHLPCKINCTEINLQSETHPYFNKAYSMITFNINLSEQMQKKFNSLKKDQKHRFRSKLEVYAKQLNRSYSDNLYQSQLPIYLELTLVEQGEAIENKVYKKRSKKRASLKFFITTPTHFFSENFGSQKIVINLFSVVSHEFAHVASAHHKFKYSDYPVDTVNEEARAELFSYLFLAETQQIINKNKSNGYQVSLLLKLHIDLCQNIKEKRLEVKHVLNHYTDLSKSELGNYLGVSHFANLVGDCRINRLNPSDLKRIKQEIRQAIESGIDFRKKLL